LPAMRMSWVLFFFLKALLVSHSLGILPGGNQELLDGLDDDSILTLLSSALLWSL
jgi:hypothetical protein